MGSDLSVELFDIARDAALAGGRVALELATLPDLEIREKAASDDLVSRADEEAEDAIRRVILGERPQDSVTGEERGFAGGESEIHWLIDPIDGTTSYLYERADWAVSVAAVRAADGVVLAGCVAEPALRRVTAARLGGGTWVNGEAAECNSPAELSRALVELNFGAPEQRPAAGSLISALLPRVRDVRRSGSAAAALAHVATGRADAYWGPGLRDWDVTAGLLLVSEAGGEIGDLSATSRAVTRERWDLLATAPGIRSELRDLIAGCWPYSRDRFALR